MADRGWEKTRRLLVRHAHDIEPGHRPDGHLIHWHLRRNVRKPLVVIGQSWHPDDVFSRLTAAQIATISGDLATIPEDEEFWTCGICGVDILGEDEQVDHMRRCTGGPYFDIHGNLHGKQAMLEATRIGNVLRASLQALVDAKQRDPDGSYVLVVHPDDLDGVAAFFADDPTVTVAVSGS